MRKIRMTYSYMQQREWPQKQEAGGDGGASPRELPRKPPRS